MKAESVLCRHCGGPLAPGGQRVIGICAECMAELSAKPPGLPWPAYRREDDHAR